MKSISNFALMASAATWLFVSSAGCQFDAAGGGGGLTVASVMAGVFVNTWLSFGNILGGG